VPKAGRQSTTRPAQWAYRTACRPRPRNGERGDAKELGLAQCRDSYGACSGGGGSRWCSLCQQAPIALQEIGFDDEMPAVVSAAAVTGEKPRAAPRTGWPL